MIDDLQQEYAMRFERIARYRTAVWAILTRSFFSRWIPAQAVVLDLGCGWGEFINQIAAGRKYGMDLNPDSPGKLVPEVTFLRQDCSQPWAIGDGQLDVVFTSNFFEHLPDKDALRRTLNQSFRCLKPGGRLICMGPNIKYLPGRYWDFWDHYLPLTELSLKEGLEITGFEIDVLVDRFLPYSMSQGSTPPLMFLRWYLRMPVIWRWLGKQFLVVARKPADPYGRRADGVASGGGV